jgi:hypothetical protein
LKTHQFQICSILKTHQKNSINIYFCVQLIYDFCFLFKFENFKSVQIL